MTAQEMTERGFTADQTGKVIDDFGNEYRNEQGEIEYLAVQIVNQGIKSGEMEKEAERFIKNYNESEGK